NPRGTAIVECPIALPSPGGESPGGVAVLRYTPEQVTMRVEATRPSFLLAAEGYNSGWRAAIDGVAQTVCPANVAFMGLPVPAGKHIVKLEYRPASFAWWAAISVLTWAALSIWALFLPVRVNNRACPLK